MEYKYITKSAFQTKKLGEKLARQVLKNAPKEKAFIIGLKGDLGGGKTCFLQGFAKGLGIKEKILSPTFVILKKFLCGASGYFYHIDSYRIKNPKELLGLNFKKICAGPKSIVAIEWADRVQKIMPKRSLWIEFEFVSQNTRRIIIYGETRDFPFLSFMLK